MSEEDIEFEVVYAGRRWINGKEMAAGFIPTALIPTIEDQDDYSVYRSLETCISRFPYKPRDVRGTFLIVGMRYTVKGVLNAAGRVTNLYFGSLKSIDRIKDAGLLAFWSLQDDGARQSQRQQAKLKTIKEDNAADREVTRLRLMWRACPPQDRDAFEMAILRRIRNG